MSIVEKMDNATLLNRTIEQFNDQEACKGRAREVLNFLNRLDFDRIQAIALTVIVDTDVPAADPDDTTIQVSSYIFGEKPLLLLAATETISQVKRIMELKPGEEEHTHNQH